jgi:hypothetical protein
MFVPLLGVHDVESFVSVFKPIFDERTKHPVLLVNTIEESTNVPLAAEGAPGKVHRTPVRSHLSSHSPSCVAPHRTTRVADADV